MSAVAFPSGRVEEPLRLSDVTPGWDLSLSDEVDAVSWILEEVRSGRPLPLLEAEFVVDSLYAELCWGGRAILPLVPVRTADRFLAVQAVNVACLSMMLARAQKFDDAGTLRIGLAALLHDLGMALLPREMIEKPGQLAPEERQRLKQHPVVGARLLLARDKSLDLAAVVAYEHHLRMDGSGYPQLVFRRSTHYVSRLVQLCDVFCSLYSPRTYRKAWPVDIILSFLAERAGFEFHPALTEALTTLVRQHTNAAAAI